MLIHKMRLDEYMAVLDVNSGAVHLVDDVIYDLLDVFDGTNDDEAIAALQTSYPEKDLREALEELHQLQEEGLLFSPEFEVPQTFAETPILKSLCLHIAHDCNLRCGYCFAGTGDFGGYRAMMSKETAEKAVEFAIAGSKMRHNLELDLFGGEPLMNPEVVKHVINYVRRREFETGKNIKLTLTTNGTLLNDDIIQFLNDNRVMLVLSLDGKKETHDNMRPFPNKTGSYDAAVRGFKKVIESRNGKNYYLRGTYTHFNPHFAEDTLDMTKIGKELSVEPVVGIDEMKAMGHEYELLYLDASDDSLIRRYKETRRRHPLGQGKSLSENIAVERERLTEVRNRATHIIDTTDMPTAELKEKIWKLYSGNGGVERMIVLVQSFGFKHGLPLDSDMVLDVRFLPNPFYEEDLKRLTGNDQPVADFICRFPQTFQFLKKEEEMLEFLLPQYISEGKSQLVISVGCTGGQHRSVFIANRLYEFLRTQGYAVQLTHRDLQRKNK